MFRTFALCLLGWTLTACTTEGLIDTAFPDRERYAFRSQDGETIMQYACEPKTSATASKANARRAHQYFDREFSRLVNSVVNDVIGGTSPNARSLNARIDRETERIVETTEARYQCLAYSFRDT